MILLLKIRTILIKQVFIYKENTDSYIIKFKARLYIRGNLQLSIYKRDVYAITATFRTFRLLIALITIFNFKVIHLNAVNAFINANINKEVYIITPKGYKEERKNIVFKLKKVLYGLRKSLKLQFIKILVTLRRLGLISIFNKLCLFIYLTKPIIIIFYINNILFIATKLYFTNLKELVINLINTYKIKKLKKFN